MALDRLSDVRIMGASEDERVDVLVSVRLEQGSDVFLKLGGVYVATLDKLR